MAVTKAIKEKTGSPAAGKKCKDEPAVKKPAVKKPAAKKKPANPAEPKSPPNCAQKKGKSASPDGKKKENAPSPRSRKPARVTKAIALVESWPAKDLREAKKIIKEHNATLESPCK